MRQIFFAGLLGLMAGIWEVAVRPFVSTPWTFRPLLPLVVILLVASRRSRALAAAIGGAVIIDLYALPVFDFALVRWVFLVFLLNFLIHRVLTHRSLYAAVTLAVVGRLVERVSAWILGKVMIWIGASDFSWSGDAVWWIPFVWDIGFVAALFLILAFLTQRFLTFIHGPQERSREWI